MHMQTTHIVYMDDCCIRKIRRGKKGLFMKKYGMVIVMTLLMLSSSALADLRMTEVVSKNLTLRLDESMQAHDYVTVTNTRDSEVNIGGCMLTDGGQDTYVFDERIMKPGESVTVYCTGERPDAPFKLSSEGETLYLYNAHGGLLHELTVPALSYNQRYCDDKVLEGNDGERNSLYISELLSVNTLFPVNGGTPDFIEIHNPCGTDLNLTGYGISDHPDKPGKWRFPDTVLPAGGYLAIYLTEAEMGFGLSSEGECVLLTDPTGNALDYVTFGPMQNDVAMARESNQWVETFQPTPGEANVIMDKETYEQMVFEGNTAGLYINEVVADNGTFDLNGNAYDYVELYNGTKKGIRLTDYFLSDDILNPDKWSFPKGSTLPAGAYAIVYMAGRDLLSSKPNTYYATFKLKKTNGAVFLSGRQGVVDHVSLGRQHGNIAYSRVPEKGAFSFFEMQTPKSRNQDAGFSNRAGDVVISPAGGLYAAPVTVTLSAEKGSVIRYTLDGGTPTVNSPEYTGQLEINANTVLRARAFEDGLLSSKVSSASFLYGVDVSVPVVSLITDQKYLTDPGTGLFVKGFGSTPNYYQNWEYPIHVQYFDDGRMLLNQLASFCVSGGLGLTRPQKTVSIFARGALGEDRFDFNPFPNREYDSYKALTLRSGGTESRGTRFKDELLTSLAKGLHVMYQDALPVVVYINGQYWGHYNLREKINQDSIAQWEGVTDEDTIEGISILRSRGSVVQGSRAEMEALIQFCRYKDLKVSENLQYVLDRLDVMSYFDHAILEIVSGNSDMHNVRYYMVPGGKWKLALFDMDGCMDNVGRQPLNLYLTRATEKMDRFFHEPFAALMNVPKMRDLFLTRFGEILHEKFIAKDLAAKVDEWAAVIGPLMGDHVKRWPDTSLARWQKYVDLLRTIVRERPTKMVDHVAKAFQLADDQVQHYFGVFLEANKQ